jgi:hypothetical protein
MVVGLIAIGVITYWLRSRFRLLYAALEMAVAITMMILAVSNGYSQVTSSLLIGLLAGIYVFVRAMDNLNIGISQLDPGVGEWWKNIFEQKIRQSFPAETSAYREWTQYDIVSEARKIHPGSGFFDAVKNKSEEVFAELEYVDKHWEYPMGDLTVGEILDFCGKMNLRPSIRWHDVNNPTAYIRIEDDLVTSFEQHFGIHPINPGGGRRVEGDGL